MIEGFLSISCRTVVCFVFFLLLMLRLSDKLVTLNILHYMEVHVTTVPKTLNLRTFSQRLSNNKNQSPRKDMHDRLCFKYQCEVLKIILTSLFHPVKFPYTYYRQP